MTAAARPLVSTRISEREHRPRSLSVAKTQGYKRAGRKVKRAQRRAEFARSQRPGPVVVLPKHVRACQWSAFGQERWFVWTWKRGNPHVKTRVAYSCNSWRCDHCRRHEAAVTFARIREATRRNEYHPCGWVMLVLTLDRDGYYSGKAWVDTEQAYRELSRMSRNFLARLRRAYDGEPGSSWVAVVEAHRSGWPHMNLLLYSPRLASEAERSRVARIEAGATERESILLAGGVLRAATATGWGVQSTCEVAHSTDSVAGYIVKLAGEADATNGELAKITQAPLTAPVRFRRLRAGYDRKAHRPFLPARRHNPNVTGVLVRRRRSPEGDWEICRINPAKDPASEQPIRDAVVAEVSVIREEEGLLSKYGEVPPMPPLRLAMGADLEPWQRAEDRRRDGQLEAMVSRGNPATGSPEGGGVRRTDGARRSRSRRNWDAA